LQFWQISLSYRALKTTQTPTSRALLAAAETLAAAVDRLRFAAPVTHVYNPLVYAWASHAEYLRRFGASRKRVVFLGMNPGPFGMAQTGIPFGEVAAVRDWMQITAPIDRPKNEHPKRPVQGLACPRSEVSGRRLWQLFAEKFGTPEKFAEEHFVTNYCPLVFCEESGRNFTPDKLSAAEQARLFAACDAHLRQVVEILEPEWLIGVGGFAQARAETVAADLAKIGMILHPSPASPAANRGWSPAATKQLESQGIWPAAGSAIKIAKK
jgi:single-strand selective monofunctional uracil DNA glycosylase